MEKLEFDYDKIYKINYGLMKAKYANKSEEFYHKRAIEITEINRRQNVTINFSRKLIDRGYDKNRADSAAELFLQDIPSELFPNIFEWIENKPISEIDYHGMSIRKIIKDGKYFLKGKEMNFTFALTIMQSYIRGGCEDQHICKHVLMRGMY